MPLPLPAYDGDPTTLQYILDLIANAITDTGGRQFKIRFGTAVVPFSAQNSKTVTVPHGLGSVPAAVYAASAQNTTAAFDAFVTADNPAPTSTVFTLQSTVLGGASVTTSITHYWLAIG